MDFCAILGAFCLLLVCSILTIILVEAVQRSSAFQKSNEQSKKHSPESGVVKYVDLFLSDRSNIPLDAKPGMSVLVDLGGKNLQTGLYLVEEDEKGAKSLQLINVPQPQEEYHIKRGLFANHTHVIKEDRANQLELPHTVQFIQGAQPTQNEENKLERDSSDDESSPEWNVLSPVSSTVQLDQEVNCVVVSPEFKPTQMELVVNVDSNLPLYFRRLEVVNMSKATILLKRNGTDLGTLFPGFKGLCFLYGKEATLDVHVCPYHEVPKS